jgi:hypothetical protein
MALCWILFKSWGACGSGPRGDRKRRRHLRRYMREGQPPAPEPRDEPRAPAPIG